MIWWSNIVINTGLTAQSVSHCFDSIAVTLLHFALSDLQPPNPSDSLFCHVQHPEDTGVLCLLKVLQRSLENSHRDAVVEMRVHDFGRDVLCVAGHDACRNIDVCVRTGKTAVQKEKTDINQHIFLPTCGAPCKVFSMCPLLTTKSTGFFFVSYPGALQCVCAPQHPRWSLLVLHRWSGAWQAGVPGWWL